MTINYYQTFKSVILKNEKTNSWFKLNLNNYKDNILLYLLLENIFFDERLYINSQVFISYWKFSFFSLHEFILYFCVISREITGNLFRFKSFNTLFLTFDSVLLTSKSEILTFKSVVYEARNKHEILVKKTL